MKRIAVILSLMAFLCMRCDSCVAGSMAVSQELNLESSWTGAAEIHRGSTVSANVDELHAGITYVCSPQVSKNLMLRFGAEWQYFYFGNTGQLPLPNVLQQLDAIVGCDYQFGDQVIIRLEIRPGVYGSSFQDMSDRCFDMPIIIGGTYLSSPDVQWMLGVLVDWRSQFPVLPAPGVRWQFADRWTLYGVFPRPRVQYDLSDKLQLFAGLGFAIGTYTVGQDFGNQHGLPKLNNATLDYFEYRAGGGCSWKLLPNVTLDVDAGALIGRWIGYVKPDVVMRSKPAPYVQVALQARF